MAQRYFPYEYKEIELLDMANINIGDIVAIGYTPFDNPEHIMMLRAHPDPFRQWQARNPPVSLFFVNKDDSCVEFARTKDEEAAIHFAYAFSNLLKVDIRWSKI